MSDVPRTAWKPHWLSGRCLCLKETIEQYTSQGLPGYAQVGNAFVVVARLAVAFPLVDVDDTGIFGLLWDFSLAPYALEAVSQFLYHDGASCLVHFSRDSVGSRSFATGEQLDSLSDFFFSGEVVQLRVGSVPSLRRTCP